MRYGGPAHPHTSENVLNCYPLAMTTPASDEEAERVAVLRGYGILESAPERAYDEIAELAAHVCNCPAAVINFVDDTNIWSKCR